MIDHRSAVMTISSFEPQHDAGELDEAEEIGDDPVVTYGDWALLFQASKEALDAPASLIGDAVVAVLI